MDRSIGRIRKASVSLLLAFVMIALALPAPVNAARGSEPTNPTYTVKTYYQNGRLWVEFKDTEAHKFVVKARDADLSKGGWARLGTLHNKAKKKGAAIFPVPKSLKGVPRLNICLKDQSSDILICRMVIVP